MRILPSYLLATDYLLMTGEEKIGPAHSHPDLRADINCNLKLTQRKDISLCGSESGSVYRCKERFLHTMMFPCCFF